MKKRNHPVETFCEKRARRKTAIVAVIIGACLISLVLLVRRLDSNSRTDDQAELRASIDRKAVDAPSAVSSSVIEIEISPPPSPSGDSQELDDTFVISESAVAGPLATKELLPEIAPAVWRKRLIEPGSEDRTAPRYTHNPQYQGFVAEKAALSEEIKQLQQQTKSLKPGERNAKFREWESKNGGRLRKHRELAVVLGELSVDAGIEESGLAGRP